MKNLIIFTAINLILHSCNTTPKEISAPKLVGPVTSETQLAWQEMELNAFIHFTTNTFTGKEWGYGDEDPSIFNPSETDVDQWITTLKEAGIKGVILTAKHHDGFCLWPSQYTEHSIKNSPYKDGKGDLVKEVSEACKRHGLKFGVYLSPWDRNRADYGEASYIEYYRNQLKEIFTAYGPVFEMWFDGTNGGDGYYGGTQEIRNIDKQTYYNWPATLDLVRELQPCPQVLFFSDGGPDIRWVGNEKGLAGETNWNTISNDTLYAGKEGINELLNTGSENGNQWIPGEVDVSIRPGWFYHEEEDSLVKSAERLFEIYLTSVGRGSNLLLNVPPDRRGLIHENDVAALRAWRKLIDDTFRTNLAANAPATATAYRGGLPDYAAACVTDGNKSTYWATDDGVTTASVEIGLEKEQSVSYILIQEYIPLGQRVRSFTVEARQGNSWTKIAEGTTIGYKRILKTRPLNTSQIRVNITDARACPLISNIEVY
ncbi:alpha-L-fucosidase [Sinomicrobium pectinilyticum]|uniref:alpha-L-fucosidase n=1 Tax=Sinomicrobium pectinilyticum TaxID=1084421 RepID=A0A3N0DQK4_SINP1|nr:alpha-L-fucosidase [Sinomicrobium pectinilyticum]RNL77925.1 glycoside hydrolase family 29 [Sinomicrobium pectinilyticum]